MLGYVHRSQYKTHIIQSNPRCQTHSKYLINEYFTRKYRITPSYEFRKFEKQKSVTAKPVSCLLKTLQLADLTNQEAEYTHSCFLEFWTAQFLSVSSSWFEFLDILILDTTFCFEFSCNLLDSARAFFVQGES